MSRRQCAANDGCVPNLRWMLLVAAAGCGAGEPGSLDADTTFYPDAAEVVCGVAGSGTHRLFLQGHGVAPDERGVYPMLHEWGDDNRDAQLCDDSVFVDDTSGVGTWQPGEEPPPLGPSMLVHGEHFLVGVGAVVEFETTLCDDITGDIAFYVPNFDVSGSRALHQLFVVHDDEEFLIAEAIDEEAGQSGYNPFVRVLSGDDPDAQTGDILRMRTTNLNGLQFSVMIWQPPSEYESWILVTVP